MKNIGVWEEMRFKIVCKEVSDDITILNRVGVFVFVLLDRSWC